MLLGGIFAVVSWLAVLRHNWTLFALTEGRVTFDKGSRRVNILPVAAPAAN